MVTVPSLWHADIGLAFVYREKQLRTWTYISAAFCYVDAAKTEHSLRISLTPCFSTALKENSVPLCGHWKQPSTKHHLLILYVRSAAAGLRPLFAMSRYTIVCTYSTVCIYFVPSCLLGLADVALREPTRLAPGALFFRGMALGGAVAALPENILIIGRPTVRVFSVETVSMTKQRETLGTRVRSMEIDSC